MNLKRAIDDIDLVFLDLETTGLDVVEGDAICEIGALRTRGDTIVKQFQTLVNPGKSIPPQAHLIHKISDQDVKSAPSFRDVFDGVQDFLQDSIVCAYNAEFDLGFIKHQAWRENRVAVEFPAMDILSMARTTVKLTRYKLESAARFFGIDTAGGFHRAISDAQITFQVFLKLRDMLRERNLTMADDYVSLFGVNNTVFRSKEEPKIVAIKEAMSKEIYLKIRYFADENVMRTEKIRPLIFFQERNSFYLWYQGAGVESRRININRIFDIEIA
ncbi:MAG: 3'-5' exonuclease [Candidatus Omnitrophota bacterium]|nr:3'-5' exonuclease [Candidatus Omnitrophota bacterium]